MSETNFVCGSLTRWPRRLEHPWSIARENDEHARSDRAEQQQPKVVVREHDAQRQYRAEIIDEARGENDLADFGVVETGLDHHRIDDRDRGRRKRDASDLRLRPRPTDDEMRVSEHPEVRRDEAHDANRHARPEVLPDDARIDFRPGEERQEDRAEPGEEIDPVGDVKADEVARDGTDHNLDERDRHRDAN